MPWTARDADRHAEGLTPQQRRVWARVANDALRRCTTAGGSAQNCEGRAIRQANAVARRVPEKGLDLGMARSKVVAAKAEDFKLPEGGDTPGYVEAAFSIFGEVDSDRDIVEASAFTDGQEVPMVWAHDWQKPVGKGAISVDGRKRAVFKGSFFLNTEAGREAYETVKAMGGLQQWSWGFRVTDASQDQVEGEYIRRIKGADVYEVSPVLVGANRNTHTLLVKSDDLADDGSDLDDAAIAALVDAVGDVPDGEDETPDGDEQPTPSLTMEEEADVALAAADGYLSRVKALVALRRGEGKVGRAISAARRERLNTLESALRSAANHIRDLIAEADPKPEDDGDDESDKPKKGAAPDAAARLRLARLQTARLRTATLSKG